MTDKLDKAIRDTLAEDERDLLARIGDEPGFFAQAFATFRGPFGWVASLMYAMNILAFIGFLFCGWRLLHAAEAVAAIRWGVGVIVLSQLTIYFKGSFAGFSLTNRTLREIRRLQLMVAQRDMR